MADILITKLEGARRQLDAAIRILFSGEDSLAIHTIAAAAHRVLADLDKERDESPVRDFYEKTRVEVRRRFPEVAETSLSAGQFLNWLRRHKSQSANFLKHADRDADKALDVSTLEKETDDLLLETCALYIGMNLGLTPEMRAFTRWHLAVYPQEEGDKIKTAAGAVHDLDRAAQVEFGGFLLEQYRKQPPT